MWRTAFGLLTSGKLETNEMITHKKPFPQAVDACDRIGRYPEQTIKVVLDFPAD